MGYRSAHFSRRKLVSRLKRVTAAVMIGGAGCAALAVLVYETDLARANQPAVAAANAAAAPATLASSAPEAGAPARRVYRYSIVPGGVTSRDQLAHVVKTDKVAAAHYAAFNVDNASELKVAKPRAVYVSYRKGDKVYWTAKKVMLAEGETLLSDGRSEIRGRCGNRISEVPQMPVETVPVSEEELDSVEQAQGTPEQAGLVEARYDVDQGAHSAGQTNQSVIFPNEAGLAVISGGQVSKSASPAVSAVGQPVSFGRLDGGSSHVLGEQSSKASSSSGGTEPSKWDSGSSTNTTTPADPAPTQNAGNTPNTPTSSSDTAETKPSSGGTSDTPTTPGVTPGTPTTPGGTPEMPTTPGDNPGTKPAPGSTSETQTPPKSPPTELPEPGTLWLSATAFAAMLLLRRTKAGFKR